MSTLDLICLIFGDVCSIALVVFVIWATARDWSNVKRSRNN